MLKSLQTRLKKAGRWLPVALLPFAAQAQVPGYSLANTANVAGTFTSIGTTGTAIATANTDDANSAATPIGFSFSYNGTTFTDFVLNTNGFIRLGTAAPSSAALFYTTPQAATGGPIASTNAADVNLIMPFAVDLTAGTVAGTGYQVATSGAAGSRVTTIQWTNVQDKVSTIATQLLNFSFQVKLYESGQIEFVYGPTTPNTTGSAFRYVAVGIKGSSAAASLTVTKGSVQLWSAATFAIGNYAAATNAHNVRQTAPADAGRTYRFARSLANDVAVSAVYTQGQLATFSPARIDSAYISNLGSNAYTGGTATLAVTRGATTLFTTTAVVPALAPGAGFNIGFAAYSAATMANVGTNNVTVSLSGSDDNNANNTRTLDQVVSATTVNYASPATATPGGASFGAAGAGNVGSAFATTTTRQVTSIQAYLANGAGTATGVLFDGTGAELGRSAVRTLTAADAGTLVTFTLTSPVNIGAGSFFAGLNLTGGATLGAQTEAPTRPGAFFQINAGPTLADLGPANLGRFNLGAITAAATSTCLGVTGLAVGTITSTSANITFTAPAGATGYTVTYTPAAGTATTVTPAPTASPVALSGLTPNTAYTVSVTTNCAAGQTSGTVTTTFTTPAVAPANDNCATATVLAVGTTCTNLLGTTTGATASTAPVPAPACGGPTLGPLADVWYSITVPASGTVIATTSAATGSPLNDTVLELYSGTCGALTSVGCNDDINALTNSFSSVTVTGRTPGTTLYARVRAYGTSANGAFNICATSAAPAVCADPTAFTVGTATNTSVPITFTPGAGNVSYNVTYSAGGTPVAVTPAPTASPVTITGLAPGTAYIITLQGVCAGGATGAVLTRTVTTTGTPAPATYATLPYVESFEGPWVNGLSTRDLPTANWRNTPATGDNSWRRDDDGASANWRFLPTGAYTPAFSAGARSARFRSYAAGPAGVTGKLDLYINLSGASTGARTLTFDYINPTGTDKLEVFLSTDGGATFGTTALLTANVNAAFAAKTVVIPSTSATAVIRLQATSDFGNDDLGIDNLRLSVVTATTNAALAATVSLYPNPAHQSFQLSVPTGLRAASATLSNALGQMVQSRQLNLPATGGTAEFNVSSLAPGIYTLTLKSGADLVVKRVVVE